MLRRAILAVVGLITLSGAISASDQDSRSLLVMEPHVLYENVLIDLNKRDWTHVKKTLGFLQPLLVDIDPEKLISIEQSIEQHDHVRSKILLIDIVGLGVVAYLKSAPFSEQAKIVVQRAFSEYLAIDPYVRQVDPALSQSLMSDFKILHAKCIRDNSDRASAIDRIGRQLERAVMLLDEVSQ